MARGFMMRAIPALMLASFAGLAGASGFQLMEHNASGLGNAYAGSAAVAENASTIYFNPAGMTQLKAREISGGLAAIKPTFRFHDRGSSAGALASAGEGGDAGGWAAVPNGFVSWALTRDLYAGLGISVPFGLKTEYDDHWLGAAQSTLFEIKTININPSLAYRVSDRLSLGLGLNWQKVEAEYSRIAGTTAATSLVKSTMNLEDSAWGWNIGVLLTPSSSTKIGFSYRSKIKYHPEGDVKLSSNGSTAGNATLAALLAGGRQSDVKADLTLPDTFTVSVAQKLDDKWEMLGDLSRTGWSSIPKVDIMRSSGVLSGQTAQTLETDFRDTWRVSWGGNYAYNDAWKLKFGVAYDESPVKRASSRMTSLPDNDRIWLNLGVQWSPDKASRLDFGMAYLYVRDCKINNDQTAYARGRVAGEYSGDIWVFGTQYSLSF